MDLTLKAGKNLCHPDAAVAAPSGWTKRKRDRKAKRGSGEDSRPSSTRCARAEKKKLIYGPRSTDAKQPRGASGRRQLDVVTMRQDEQDPAPWKSPRLSSIRATGSTFAGGRSAKSTTSERIEANGAQRESWRAVPSPRPSTGSWSALLTRAPGSAPERAAARPAAPAGLHRGGVREGTPSWVADVKDAKEALPTQRERVKVMIQMYTNLDRRETKTAPRKHVNDKVPGLGRGGAKHLSGRRHRRQRPRRTPAVEATSRPATVVKAVVVRTRKASPGGGGAPRGRPSSPLRPQRGSC